jgi:hypothetical protein
MRRALSRLLDPQASEASWERAALKQRRALDRLTSELFNDAPRRFAPVDVYALA